jgi:hypothetical protein
MTTPIQLVFDTEDPDREARFWAEALGYRMQPPPGGFDGWPSFLREQGIPEDRWNDASAIVDPDGKGPRIYFQRVPEDKSAKNRMHMDLNVSGGRGVPLDDRKQRVDAGSRLKSGRDGRTRAIGATASTGRMNDRKATSSVCSSRRGRRRRGLRA